MRWLYLQAMSEDVLSLRPKKYFDRHYGYGWKDPPMHKSDDALSTLGPLLKDQLQALNFDFLALLISEHGKARTQNRSPTLFLPPAVAGELGQLAPKALSGIAQ